MPTFGLFLWQNKSQAQLHKDSIFFFNAKCSQKNVKRIAGQLFRVLGTFITLKQIIAKLFLSAQMTWQYFPFQEKQYLDYEKNLCKPMNVTSNVAQNSTYNNSLEIINSDVIQYSFILSQKPVVCVHGSIDAATEICVCDSGWFDPVSVDPNVSYVLKCTSLIDHYATNYEDIAKVPFYKSGYFILLSIAAIIATIVVIVCCCRRKQEPNPAEPSEKDSQRQRLKRRRRLSVLRRARHNESTRRMVSPRRSSLSRRRQSPLRHHRREHIMYFFHYFDKFLVTWEIRVWLTQNETDNLLVQLLLCAYCAYCSIITQCIIFALNCNTQVARTLFSATFAQAPHCQS
eukprot:TRINITY_DN286_c0_g1_i1.p1 TRINITY_DN286_c0_g1~~TRINITY_DN286_c0_g1_i1.p1  ORF type:complete len:344 (-),score=-46.34 TRINITY_DN286_c0_g1_i1:354-1385(-)